MTLRLIHIGIAACVFFAGLQMTLHRHQPVLPDRMNPARAGREEGDAKYALEAMRWYNDQRAYPAGRIPDGWREKAVARIEALNKSRTPSPSSLSWNSVGPTNIGGRVRSVAVDPTNSSVIYAGSVSGGIWKTTNAGSSWTPLTDMASNLVIGCIAIDPNNHNVVYAGTGEGYFNVDALRGIGVLKSTDGGASWTVLNNFISVAGPYYYYFINKIVIRPDNSSILFAATSGAPGLWKSTDGGGSWNKISISTSSTFCVDLVIDPSNNNNMYAAYGLFTTDGIYKSTNGGTSWSKLTNTFPPTTQKYGRISLGIAPSSPSTLYACLADSNYYTHSIQRTTDGGGTWTQVATPFDNSLLVNATHLGGQGWYNNVIQVDPADPNTVYTGGINLFKSTNGGSNWTEISDAYSGGIHVDQHAIVFDTTNTSVVYFGNDGGVFRTTNAGSSFASLNNGLVTVQFYSGAVHPTSDVYYGGTQDNGTLKSGALPSWSIALSGDGGSTAVDFVTPTTVYTEYVYLSIQKSANSGGNWGRIMSGIPTSGNNQFDGTSDRCLFIAPFVMDPSSSTTLVAGTYRVYRTTNGGSSWSAISSDLTGDAGGANGLGQAGSCISALAIAPTTSGTIYAGTSGSATSAARVSVTVNGTNASPTWTNVTGSLPNRYVKWVAVSPTSAATAYVTFSGYNANTPLTPGHIFRTTNTGGSWTNVSGDLQDIPVNTLVVDSTNASHLIAGTDLGVFESTNGGTNWIEANGGLARVSVAELDRRKDAFLFAATHGRGMFKSATAMGVEKVVSPIPQSFALEQNYPNPFNPTTKISFSIPVRSRATLAVFDAAGREISRMLNDQELPAGTYQTSFDGSSLASGVYFYRLSVSAGLGNQATQVRKMVLVK